MYDRARSARLRACRRYRQYSVPHEDAHSNSNPPTNSWTTMSEHANERPTEHQLQLHRLQQEVQRQGRELDAVATKLHEQKRSLDALKTQLAVVMGSWRSEVRRDLTGLIREIDSTNDNASHWEQLRRQVEIAYPEFAQHAGSLGAELSPIESKVWMLMGMSLSTAEIATVLNRSEQRISECRERIARKLQRAGTSIDGQVAAVASAAQTNSTARETPRTQATARGGR